MKVTNYKGAGNHSVKELESILEGWEILLNIRQVDSQDLRLERTQMQNDIDELVDFVKKVNYLICNEILYSKSIELIQKHIKK